ncbi:MAG: indolepyruvate oxidoreductase subunit beta [Spirochaetes bacterium]|nr:indolepyruvate oxidoreductase subunit beta [Spirochaetota bacterium]
MNDKINDNKLYNILFCGIGGQGVLKASEVCAWAALYDGYSVKKSEVHGMSQRGGSVESHLRFGHKVYSPLIPEGKADFLVSFFKDEHDRLLHFLKKDGKDLISYLVKAEKEINDKRLINTYLLGVLSKNLPLIEDSWLKAIEKVFTKLIDNNINIFLKGRGEK